MMTNRSWERQRRILDRLNRFNFPADTSVPMFRASNVHFELSDRTVATAYGGVALMDQLVKWLGLAAAIDARLHLFKIHAPYHESDHVLNLVYNVLCDGRCLQDLECRRHDEGFLNVLGALRIPDPTTAGDFCRRFQPADLVALQQAIDVARLKIWACQPAAFFRQAILDADGTMVETGAECKAGIDISYKGVWGYHPLVVTLANTGEVMRLCNRSGNRPSHEGAAQQLDQCIALCRAAGFHTILLRGDTDFSQTEHLDRWHEQGDVKFCFGMDVSPKLHVIADDLLNSDWKPLERPAKFTARTEPRSKPPRVKQTIVEDRKFEDIRLVDELVAEFEYRPKACGHTYRMIAVRKILEVSHPREQRLFDDYEYRFYMTNDFDSAPEQIVFTANDRCNQENILAQLKSVRALHAPVDNLLSNNAYMLITSLAWTLKAWLALSLPTSAGTQKDKQVQVEQKRRLLTMEFRTFVNMIIRLPAQIVHTGRRLVVRLLAWNEWQNVFFRLANHLHHPLRQ